MNEPSRTDLIMHPIRLRILGTVANRELTPQQILKTLPDISQASVYRHIRLLADAGILRVVEERPIRGVVEHVYTVATEEAVLGAKSLPRYTREDMIRYFGVFVETVINQFRLYSGDEAADPIKDGVGYWGDTAHLTLEERNELVGEIQALVKRYRDNPATPDRLRYHLCHELFPDKTRLKATEK